MGFHRKRERESERERERDGQQERKRERERVREDAVYYEKGGYCPIDVETVETSGKICCHLS